MQQLNAQLPVNNIRINKAIVLRRCIASANPSANCSTRSATLSANPPVLNIQSDGRRNKRLAILFGWLMARDEHLDKYIRLYQKRGFDVLTVRSDLQSIALPNYGSRVLATKVLNFLKDFAYQDIIAQGFSIGGYQFGELLVTLKHEKEVDARAHEVCDRFRGMIFDSMVDLAGGEFQL